jgi:hypothetical protein
MERAQAKARSEADKTVVKITGHSKGGFVQDESRQV